MISYSTVLLLILVHFVADFVLQTDWQAKNKWENSTALLRHTSNYALVMTLVFGWKFGLATWAAHTCTDAITSKGTHRLADKQDWHNFFVVVGFDQVLHYVQLLLTYQFLFDR